MTGGFFEVSASGGTPRRIGTVMKNPVWRWPQILPDGKAVLFAGGTAGFAFGNSASIAVAALGGTGEEKDLILGTMPHLTATGDLLYAQNATLIAVPFSSKRPELAGSSSPVLEGVRQSMLGAAQHSLSTGGTLVYIPGAMHGTSSRLVWVDRAGKEQLLPAPEHGYNYPRLSPDGRRITITISETDTQAWLYDIARDAMSRATFGRMNLDPIWSPDGIVSLLFLEPAAQARQCARRSPSLCVMQLTSRL
jgi:WD40-like Beta Propeller Repeat